MKIIRHFILLWILCLGFCVGHSQAGTWTWIHGTKNSNDKGHFGIQGVPDTLNYPPSLYEACEWKDQNGNFWLFGGTHIDSIYSDLWKYSPTTNIWTWMKGPGIANDSGLYGIRGVSSPKNNPPPLSFGPI